MGMTMTTMSFWTAVLLLAGCVLAEAQVVEQKGGGHHSAVHVGEQVMKSKERVKAEIQVVVEESRSVARSSKSNSLVFLVTAAEPKKYSDICFAVQTCVERAAIHAENEGLILRHRDLTHVGITVMEIHGQSPKSEELAGSLLLELYQSGVQGTVESDGLISLGKSSPSLESPAFSSLKDSTLKPPTERKDSVNAEGRLVPNDSLWTLLWGMEKSFFPEAWDMVYSEVDPPFDPQAKVKVIVIDSGVERNHPDLSGNMWVNLAELDGQPGVDDDNNGYVDDIYGWDAVRKNGDPMDDNGHGTHVAGTIGAVTNNSIGVSGANWSPEIVACRFIGSNGMGSTADAIDCINYSLANGVRVSNNSWGSGYYSSALKAAIGAAEAAGQVFVTSAGNSGDDVDSTPSYPGAFDNANIVNVAATSDQGSIPSWSNYGATTVDIAAPGAQIASTYYLNGNYVYYSGTSMASPHVSGLVSLMLVVNPSMSVQKVRTILENASSPLPGIVVWGVMNAQSSIQGAYDSLASTSTTTTTTTTTTSTTTPSSSPAPCVAFPVGANCRTQCRLIGRECDDTTQLLLDTDLAYCRATLRSTFPVFFGPAFEQPRWNAPSGCFFDPPGGFNIVLNTNDFGSGKFGCDGVPGTPSGFYKACACFS